MNRARPETTLLPYTTLFRSPATAAAGVRDQQEERLRVALVLERLPVGRVRDQLHPVEDLRRPLRSEEHTSELQSRRDLVCRVLLEKKNNIEYREMYVKNEAE